MKYVMFNGEFYDLLLLLLKVYLKETVFSRTQITVIFKKIS